ncbi:Response regulator receiver domain-containing protein [Lachnospiraceae bacterium XBB1006]|nr:Response regulator receiver domain-containing protein [Lachnospiraceae bacterium XBB1006]
MENRLLLINKRAEVVQEFLRCFEHEDFIIDVAMSGVEGFERLRDTEYKVVVTGTVFHDIDGEKLLNYIAKNKPETVCIVYTTKLSVAQVAYLTNRLHVFRVFLRPGDYRGEMLTGIQEAFELYDVREAEKEIEKEERKNLEMQKERFDEMRQRVMEREEADTLLLRIFEPILNKIVESGDDLEEVERAQLLSIERQIIAQYMKENQQPVGGLGTVEVKLRHQFFEGFENRRLRVQTGSMVIQLNQSFVDSVYMCIWLLVRRITMLTKSFQTDVTIDFETSTKVNVDVRFKLPDGVWQEEENRALSKKITAVHEQVVRDLCSDFIRKPEDGGLVYHMLLDSQKEVVFDT